MKLISTKEFYEGSEEPLPWIIDPFAVRGSMILLYGRQGIGKSSLAWQLAHAISTGGQWLGHPILRPGPVIYLNLDMPHLEFRRMLERATEAGMPPSNDIVVPEVGDLDDFDVIHHPCGLTEACTEINPRALIVDTVADAYMPGTIRDINAEARAVIKVFRRLVPYGILLLLMHDRKRSAFHSWEQNESDPDAFNGPSAWEAKATSSFRMTSSDNGMKLHVKKTRLDAPPYQQLMLQRTEHGFMEAKRTYIQGLHEWEGTAKSLTEVFEDVAKRYNERPDTVRQGYYRALHRGIKFPWAEAIKESAGA